MMFQSHPQMGFEDMDYDAGNDGFHGSMGFGMIQSNSFCEHTTGHRFNGDLASPSFCYSQVKRHDGCGQVFFYSSHLRDCVCVGSGHQCQARPHPTYAIYHIFDNSVGTGVNIHNSLPIHPPFMNSDDMDEDDFVPFARYGSYPSASGNADDFPQLGFTTDADDRTQMGYGFGDADDFPQIGINSDADDGPQPYRNDLNPRYGNDQDDFDPRLIASNPQSALYPQDVPRTMAYPYRFSGNANLLSNSQANDYILHSSEISEPDGATLFVVLLVAVLCTTFCVLLASQCRKQYAFAPHVQLQEDFLKNSFEEAL